MKIWIYSFLVLYTTISVLGDYPRFKLRAPLPPPQRSSPSYPHQKKWQQKGHLPPQRPPLRSRPIPVHMPQQHKIQMGVPQNLNRPVAPPVRTFWKNTQTTFRTPVEKKPYHHVTHNSVPVLPEKSFLGSPSINAQEYEFHLQTNAIPNHINTIKQVGEKGPIHTIPAPNLSLADKPVVVEEVKHVHHGADTSSYIQIQKSHQYQVTEAPEQQKQKVYRNQNQQKPQLYTEVYLGGEQQQQQQQPKEVYQLVNSFPQAAQQPQVLESYAIPVAQQPQNGFIQQLPTNYQMLFAQNPNYQIQEATDKISIVQPEFHSFNYEEPKKDSTKKELSSLVTSSYNLEPEAEASETIHTTLHRNNNNLDVLAQSQYVQNYFDTREDNVNNVEPDAKPSQEVKQQEEQQQQQQQQPQEEEETGYYVRLPSKQAADSLASLQAAGKINSNLMEMSKKKPIYVPDESQSEESENEEFSKQYKTEEEYDDDYSQEQEDGAGGFGHKLQTKRS